MRLSMFAVLIIAALSFTGLPIQGQAPPENQNAQMNDLVIGYALPKTSISATQILTSPFKPLKSGEVYQSLGKTTNGVLIVCELTNGRKALALMSFKDALGYQVVIRERENNKVAIFHPILDNLDTVKIKPAEVMLEAGHRYDVAGRISL